MSAIIRWFPPAWCQIRGSGKVVYIDPAYLRTHFARHPRRIEFSRWPGPIDGLPEELAPGDLILVTHSHKDHLKKVTVDRLRGKSTLVAAPKRCGRELGGDFQAVSPGEELALGDIRVRAVESYNAPRGASTRKVHRKGQGVGYVVSLEGRSIYHAGDTDLIPEMGSLGEIDVALLPIGGTYTMDPREAQEAALLIRPRVVIPIHRMKADPRAFQKEVEARSDIRVAVLGIGEQYRLP